MSDASRSHLKSDAADEILQSTEEPEKPRRRFRPSTVAFIIAILVSLFAGAGFYGNYVQWRHAGTTQATITDTVDFALLKSSNTTVKVAYRVGKGSKRRTHRAELSMNSARIAAIQEKSVPSFDVYYMKKNPDRVIAIDVLNDKKKGVRIAVIVGAACAGLGLLARFIGY